MRNKLLISLFVLSASAALFAQPITRALSQLFLVDGSASAPSATFAAETNTGWYRAGASNLAATVGGTSQISIIGGGITTNATGGAYHLSSVKFIIATAPTISSGFGTSPSILTSNGTVTFRVDVGSPNAATSGVVGMPAASTGWNCQVTDKDTNVVTRQTASTTTSVTVTGASAWTAADDLIFNCAAY